MTDEEHDSLPLPKQVSERNPKPILCNDKQRRRPRELVLRQLCVLIKFHRRVRLSMVLTWPHDAPALNRLCIASVVAHAPRLRMSRPFGWV